MIDIPVPFEEDVDDVLELVGVVGAEETVLDLVYALFEFRYGFVVRISIVAFSLQQFHFVDVHPENKYVFGSHLFGHFHICTVHRADGECTVQLKTKHLTFNNSDEYYSRTRGLVYNAAIVVSY